ncbi:transporter substrate-binding domain-containing protein [Paraglaciecola aquimarina]|uniref:Transporter substrate-binding domain-containing protein n=1 Tax=Paraglaciecola aquimarina TaxID=1235557 RepID=A0ABU3SWR9_9ALTE|nr:transporter substrate-binding domain-containing protein [Paraglaciecola aquimarina]MDU0354456.1 transporter substrate-binding domain-containing protein [Paraglaciecola aquimarina]
MKYKHILLLFYFLAMCLHLVGVNAKTLSIGIAHFPPYSIVDGDNISGAEIEIIQRSLSGKDYQIKFLNYPFGRLPNVFSHKKLDGIIVTLKNIAVEKVYYSDIVLPEYQTVAVHLKENGLQIMSIKDLAGKSIIAHQQASQFYGEEYKRISDVGRSILEYTETIRQGAQVSMLYKNRVDIIILAREIFQYYRSRLTAKVAAREVVISEIFGDKIGFHNAFADEKVRDAFDQGLAEIKKNGQYKMILKKYLKFYQPNL